MFSKLLLLRYLVSAVMVTMGFQCLLVLVLYFASLASWLSLVVLVLSSMNFSLNYVFSGQQRAVPTVPLEIQYRSYHPWIC